MTKMVHGAGKVHVTVPHLKAMMEHIQSILGCQKKKDHSIFNVEHRYILVQVADNGDQGRPLDELVE
jgi:hypothetical protein